MSLAADEPEVIGDYRLVGRLGTGGMGTVFLGRSPSGRDVAVKVIHEQYAADPDFRTRFRQEIAAARRVSGAFTAPVVDADPDAVRPWMATQYVPGPTLAQLLESQGPLHDRELRSLALGLVEALRDIHRVGVVHRDLKPANVLMAQDGPRVIDFGVSRAVGNRALTVTGHVMGTPPFMSPEQLSSPRTIGPASDIFSLGALLVYAAVGHGPFDADSPHMTAYHVVHEPPVLDGVREPLRGILEYCLVKEPEERPDGVELASLLRKWRTASGSGDGPGGGDWDGAGFRVGDRDGTGAGYPVAGASARGPEVADDADRGTVVVRRGGQDSEALGVVGVDGAGREAGQTGAGTAGTGARNGPGEKVGDSGAAGEAVGVGAGVSRGAGRAVGPGGAVGGLPTPAVSRRPLPRRVLLVSAVALALVLGGGGLALFVDPPGAGKGGAAEDVRDGKPTAPAGRESWQVALDWAPGTSSSLGAVRCVASGSAAFCGGPYVRAARLDTATGATVWQAPDPPTAPGTRTAADSAPAGVGGKAVFVVETLSDSARRLAALDAGDGRRLWHRPVGGYRPPAVHGGLVAAADAGQRNVVARDALTGATRWTAPNPAGQACFPIVLQGQWYGSCTPSDDGAAPRTYVRYGADGSPSHLFTRGRDHELVGTDGKLLVFARWARPDDAAGHANHEGAYSSLLLVDPSGARLPRTLPLPGAPAGRPVLRGDAVLFVHHWGTVSSHGVRDGDRRWARDTGVRGLGVPTAGRAAEQDVLFVPSLSGRVLALNARSGKEVWRSAHRGAPPASYHDTEVVRVGGLLLVTGTGGTVFSLDPADPALRAGDGGHAPEGAPGPGPGPGGGPPPPSPPRNGGGGGGGGGGS
ncbi:protein kinase domain-containing protein [Streptomyces sp. CA-294286]|uniref:serine/threonine-protein kinase n=1 Tax=Streptomyces sp. CA-294286 TaxID=3240070 RepID=UPI003D9192B6